MQNDAQKILTFVNEAKTIVITAHKSPDGDSIGSSMGLFHVLKALSKDVAVVHPDPAPDFLSWVPGQDEIIDFETKANLGKELLANADLIFCLDYNDPSRVGDVMSEAMLYSNAKRVMIDHHLFPADFCDAVISDTTACSTSELVYKWVEDIDKKELITPISGQCLYLGIMTDTGSFRFPSVKAETHRIVAGLIDNGVEHYKIHEAVYDTNTIDRIRLKGYALSEKLVCLEGIPVAYASLTEDELERFNYQKGDTEGLVNQILSISGIKMAVFFSQKDGKIKISFRSKGEFEVNQLANTHFEGGGHKYASGGISSLSMEETIAKFVTNVKDFIPA